MIAALDDDVFVTQNVNAAFWFIASVFVNFSIASQTRGLIEGTEAGSSRVSAELASAKKSKATNNEPSNDCSRLNPPPWVGRGVLTAPRARRHVWAVRGGLRTARPTLPVE